MAVEAHGAAVGFHNPKRKGGGALHSQPAPGVPKLAPGAPKAASSTRSLLPAMVSRKKRCRTKACCKKSSTTLACCLTEASLQPLLPTMHSCKKPSTAQAGPAATASKASSWERALASSSWQAPVVSAAATALRRASPSSHPAAALKLRLCHLAPSASTVPGARDAPEPKAG